jgi:hypothetical protein
MTLNPQSPSVTSTPGPENLRIFAQIGDSLAAQPVRTRLERLSHNKVTPFRRASLGGGVFEDLDHLCIEQFGHV